MRLGIVRTDIGAVYLQDVENTSQRNFSSQPRGQSRNFKHPTDAQLLAVLALRGLVTIQGSDTAASVDTTGSNATKINIKASASAAYTQITVASNAALPKTSIVAQLNIGFANAGLPLLARISGTNQVTIDTTVGGPTAYVSVSASSPSTGALHTVLGITAATTSGISLATLKAAIYPTATTINVSDATINALGTFSLLSTAQKDALDDGVANLVAPRLVETGPALRSFAYGTMSKLVLSTFQPGGTRGGLPAGVAAQVLQDDGSTPYTL